VDKATFAEKDGNEPDRQNGQRQQPVHKQFTSDIDGLRQKHRYRIRSHIPINVQRAKSIRIGKENVSPAIVG